MGNEVARRRGLGVKGLVGIACCIIGLGIAHFTFNLGHEPVKKDAATGAKTAVEEPAQHRPVRTMNLALGNMVYFAHDLGFAVKTPKKNTYDGGKIALRIENQLQGLRKVYRQESVNNPSLVGGILLQLKIGPSGEVTDVKDTFSIITDVDFRKAVVSEAAKWSFNDIVAEPLTVSCPLLFVREGMDITTLVQWEKALGHFTDNGIPVKVAAGAKQQPKQRETAANLVQAKNVKAEIKIFEIKYATPLRQDPNFSSTSLMTFTIGAKVVLINGRGDWLEVKAIDNDLSGFIRKEFVTPLDVVRE